MQQLDQKEVFVVGPSGAHIDLQFLIGISVWLLISCVVHTWLSAIIFQAKDNSLITPPAFHSLHSRATARSMDQTQRQGLPGQGKLRG